VRAGVRMVRRLFFQSEPRAMDRFVRGVRLAVAAEAAFVAAGLIGSGVLVSATWCSCAYALNQNTIWQTDFTTLPDAATFVGRPVRPADAAATSTSTCCPTTSARCALLARAVAASVSLAFSVVLAVAHFQFLEGGLGPPLGLRHHVARAACGSRIPRCRIGLGLLALQYIADITSLRHRARAALGITKEA